MFSLKKVLFSVFVLLGVITVARADILAAGAAYGGPTQTLAVCYVFNAGPGPVSITSNLIIREPNVSLVLSFDSCGVLAAGASCGIAAPIVNNLAHSCRMIVSPSGADVRGSFELRESSLGRVLNNLELR